MQSFVHATSLSSSERRTLRAGSTAIHRITRSIQACIRNGRSEASPDLLSGWTTPSRSQKPPETPPMLLCRPGREGGGHTDADRPTVPCSSAQVGRRPPALCRSEGSAVADRCRCHLPLNPPAGLTHWWPRRDAEPGPAVRAVAQCGQDPGLLRRVRVVGGWRGAGAAAAYPEHTPPMPWPRVGRCWAGIDHPVADVTVFIACLDGGGAEAGLMRAAGSTPRTAGNEDKT